MKIGKTNFSTDECGVEMEQVMTVVIVLARALDEIWFMKLPVRIYVAVLVFIWFGYVAGISFLEAPLKFQAPGITLPLGLGIGRIVFGTLNKVELVFAFVISVISFSTHSRTHIRVLIGFLLMILAAQTFWLLPFLDARAEVIIKGSVPPASVMHFVYIILEAAKLILLFITGIKSLQSSLYDTQK